MSGIIKLLPEHIANQIAAGEVIQRPASVVKELVENAIDAGADKIHVIIKDAGRTLIQVIDNGKGMEKSDALLCFERHATSKVSTADDLFALKTKGFRGEALASIASISHVSLKTKTKVSEVGTWILMEGSKLISNEESVSPHGTSIEVKNLFYNVPARRNFLKSDSIEFGHIQDEFERIALAHPELSFVLKHNDQEVFQLLPAVLRKRIVDLLGKNSNDRLVPVEVETDIVRIIGYVGKPEYSRKTRGEQFFFVNNRFFKDAYFNSAVNKAFDGLLQPKMFPSYFLYLELDPSKIDVNVHPTKTEIKFEEDRSIYAILLSGIKQGLGKYNISPTLDFEREMGFDLPHSMKDKPAVEPVVTFDPTYNPFQSTTKNTGSGIKSGQSDALRAQGFGNQSPSTDDWRNFYTIEEEDVSQTGTLDLEEDSEPLKGAKIIKGTYLFTPCKSGLMVIHIARAMERILYDEIINKFISNPINSQKLLFPISRDCSKEELRSWTTNSTLLHRLGFESTIQESHIEISAVPSILEENSIDDCLDSLISTLSFKEIDKGEIAHELVRSIAVSYSKNCKPSENENALQDIIDRLFSCGEHAYSPSGKKIINTISLDEISQKF
ncbi:MAG: DNA mismatch repair endonuclease MutL [Cryomorphaceae bacterium]|nr:DNA mismatch repair endonuclease MutL [Cryomorphaceae bacterium]